jgi:CRP-like cAMP-binding protein
MKELNIVERVIALEGVDLLKGLSPEQLARIGLIGRQEQVPPGGVILDPGDQLDAMYVILDGSVELIESGERVETAGQNEVLGSWALLDESPLPVRAVALEDTTLLKITRDDFFELLADAPEIVSAILSRLVSRFRALLEKPDQA